MKVVWSYKKGLSKVDSDMESWASYSQEDNDKIEKAFQKKQTTCSLSSHVIDFVRSIQSRKGDFIGSGRPVRRLQVEEEEAEKEESKREAPEVIEEVSVTPRMVRGMQLFIRDLRGKTLTFEVDENDTGRDLMTKVFKRFKIEDTPCHRARFYVTHLLLHVRVVDQFEKEGTYHFMARLRNCPVPYEFCTCPVGLKEAPTEEIQEKTKKEDSKPERKRRRTTTWRGH